MAGLRPATKRKWRHCLSQYADFARWQNEHVTDEVLRRISRIGRIVFAGAPICYNCQAIARAPLFKAIAVRSKALPSLKR